MRVQRAHACGAGLGYAADLLFGDPARNHPVAAFGKLAAAAERVLWRDHRAAGAVHTALCAGGAVAAVAGTARIAARARPATRPARRGVDGEAGLAALAFSACVVWTALGGASLCAEAEAVAVALEAGDLAGARRRLPHLCGRDPEALDADGVARAVVESVAENTSDAVVGALLWAAVAGPAGAAGFRAVNTLDAMVGHRSPRYRRFGWAAARLDDLAGWPGARLTALLAALAGPAKGGALRAWREAYGPGGRRRHPSPNAGPVEAAFAGALGVRLGGTLAYGGRVEHRPVLGGAAAREVRTDDIARAVRLSRRVGLLALLVTAGARLAAVRAGATALGGGRVGARPGAGSGSSRNSRTNTRRTSGRGGR